MATLQSAINELMPRRFAQAATPSSRAAQGLGRALTARCASSDLQHDLPDMAPRFKLGVSLHDILKLMN